MMEETNRKSTEETPGEASRRSQSLSSHPSSAALKQRKSGRFNESWMKIEKKYAQISEDLKGKDTSWPKPEQWVNIRTLPRNPRTARELIIDRSTIVDQYIDDCLAFYCQDWITPNRISEKFQYAQPSHLPTCVYDLSSPIGNGGASTHPPIAVQGTKDDLEGNLSETETDDLSIPPDDVGALSQRSTTPLFRMYSAGPTPEEIAPSHPFTEKQDLQLMIEFKKLSFKLGDIEPFFATLAAYDLSRKEKISENIYFDIPSEGAAQLDIKNLKTSTNNKAILTITYPSPETYLVLRIEKILQGDIDDVMDPYMKYSSMKEKDRDRVMSAVKSAWSRKTPLRQGFCWAVVPLFTEDKKPTLGGVEFKTLFRHKGNDISDQHFLELVNEYSRSSSSKRSRMVPGSFLVEISEGVDPRCGRITPSLLPVNPTGKEMIPEIQEFPPSWEKAFPYQRVVNNLYCYPINLNLSSRSGPVSARNIAIKVQLVGDKDNAYVPLQAMYPRTIAGNPENPEFETESYSGVTYHTKSPQFYDEIKMKLPVQMTDKHHLLFTFYHVTCQSGKIGKLGNGESMTPVGYSWLPLYQNRIIAGKEYNLPVALELPNHYMTAFDSEVKYLDGKKPLFKLRIHTVSSLYSRDTSLNSFFTEYSRHSNPKPKVIQKLLKVGHGHLTRFLPTILNALLRQICTSPTANESYAIFVVMTQLLHIFQINNVNATEILTSYVDYAFDNPVDVPSFVYEQICRHWYSLIKKHEETSDHSIKLAWFFFKLIYKSMILKANHANQLVEEDRTDRFDASFQTKLRELVELLTYEIQQRTKSELSIARDLNRALANFLRNLLSVYDRGLTMQMIKNSVQDVNSSQIDMLVDFKFDFLRIVADYEHFTQLNLPQLEILDSISEISFNWSQSHPLLALILREIENGMSHKERHIRGRCLATLRRLLQRLDWDKTSVISLSMIASMYFPFLLSALDHLDTYVASDFEEKRHFLICSLWILKNVPRELILDWLKKESKTRLESLFSLLHHAIETFEFIGEERWIEKMGEIKQFKSSETKAALETYYTESIGYRRAGKYKTLREKRAEAARRSMEHRKLSVSNPPVSPMMLSPGNTPGNSTGDLNVSIAAPTNRLSFSREGTPVVSPVTERHASDAQERLFNSAPTSPGNFPRSESDKSESFGRRFNLRNASLHASHVDLNLNYDDNTEMNLSSEVNSIVLTTVNLVLEFLRDFQASSPIPGREITMTTDVLDAVLNLQLEMLKKNQSQEVLKHLYRSLRKFAENSAEFLLDPSKPYIADLCLDVMRHCNSPIPSIRTDASSFLLLLLKKHYDGQNHALSNRIKMTTTVAISKLVGQGIKSARFLRQSLATISKYASHGEDQVEFSRNVEHLTSRLFAIIRDSIQISESENDPEMRADLMHRIASGYTHAPDLRIAWIESLSHFHVGNSSWAEAAQCIIHIAALVAEYLFKLKNSHALPKGARDFCMISPSTAEEALENKKEQEDEDVEVPTFTEATLLKMLSRSIQMLKQADMFETANLVYKLIIPIYEKNHNYVKLARCHGDLNEIFTKILNSVQHQSRIFGTYYRIAFYGNFFEELDGKEYIYKEPKITRLGEIQDRLKSIYSAKFKSDDRLKIITDSKAVDVSKLDFNFAYIQITAVQPYFDKEELKERPTVYQRNFNISRFIFSTPFTQTGKSQAESVKDQFKRKTILKVENQFPYMKKRLLVVDKHEIVLTPIENSIETIENRCDALQSELRHNPPNGKTLQQVLQGSVLTSINVGPVEICREFLGNSDQYPSEQIHKLREGLKALVFKCDEAVLLNKSLITADQIEFQSELETGAKNLRNIMQPYLNV